MVSLVRYSTLSRTHEKAALGDRSPTISEEKTVLASTKKIWLIIDLLIFLECQEMRIVPHPASSPGS